MNIYDLGREMAKEFKNRKEDVFVETVEVEGEEVTVSVKYSPKQVPVTNEDVWRILIAQH